MEICKTFTFDAAHRLDKLPPDHKCNHLHGHTYRVDIIVDGPLDDMGMICDYAEIATAWAPLHNILDHSYLNEIEGLEIPTTEVLVKWILGRLAKERLNQRNSVQGMLCARVSRVRVYESSSTYCEAP